jgi:hypothetical protein
MKFVRLDCLYSWALHKAQLHVMRKLGPRIMCKSTLETWIVCAFSSEKAPSNFVIRRYPAYANTLSRVCDFASLIFKCIVHKQHPIIKEINLLAIMIKEGGSFRSAKGYLPLWF